MVPDVVLQGDGHAPCPPGDPPATRRPRTLRSFFFIFFAPVCEAQTGRRKHAQKRTAVLEHIKGAAGPLTAPAKDSHQEPPAKTHGPAPGLLPRPAAARAGRRDDACVGARGQAGRGSVLQRTLVPAVPWLYAQARRCDQGHGQGAGDCVCVERPRRGGL